MRARAWAVVAVLLTGRSWAGGPRFVTGSQYPTAGVVMAFYTSQPLYFTDPGSLSASVNHAQADAMVAAAAAVWNIPTANVTLAQGGQLAEHVSKANAYFDGTSVVLPNDVLPANYFSKPIAVIYDTDGSVTDLLLGSGASSPSSCRQNGVTESVDGFGATGTIQHAVIVLNGLCLTAAPQSLTQMQYQVMRAFGRVLGLAWSQVNDNVFTGSSQPTAQQMARWPVMHPIDVVCGPYTYQCMQNAFTLRPDDTSALALLYPVTSANLSAGKVLSNTNAVSVEGFTSFATGQGMDLLNMTVTLSQEGGWSSWQEASSVSGMMFLKDGGNPVSGPAVAAMNSGVRWTEQEAEYLMGAVPILPPSTGMLVVPEAVNPLYTGEYALGPYARTPMSVSGTPGTSVAPFAQPGVPQAFWITMADEPAACSPGNDGTEASPAAADASGWWSGLLCDVGHSSWWSVTVQPNRTWTVETTALNESGSATVEKAQPVLGAWSAGDPTGTLPTVASEAAAMNALALGVTQMRMPAADASLGASASYRFVVADQFGGGRPDFAYQARVLYADSVVPAVIGTSGGTITVTGTGFRQGNELLVNGVRAKVASWTATTIVATAPSQAAANAAGMAVDVEVLDAVTGASSDMASALTYSGAAVAGPPAVITAVSGAGQSIQVGSTLKPVVLQVSDSNGNAVSGAVVTAYQTDYAWEGSCAALGPCASAPVLQTVKTTLTSDAKGLATITPLLVAGAAQVVEIAAVSGTTGFLTLSVAIGP